MPWLLAALVVAATWLVVAPPELIRVGAGYTAKIVCSNTFIAGRDPDQVLALDVQAPGHPLLRLMRVSVDRNARTVRAGLFGVAGDGLAVARDGTGCATVPEGDLEQARRHAVPAAALAAPAARPWPQGDPVAPSAAGPAQYSRGQMWLHGPAGQDAPAGQNPDAAFGLPADARWMLGHDGQAIAIVPSRERVLLRLGLTPSRLGYRPQRLLAELLRALPPA